MNTNKPLKTVEEILKAYAGIDDGKLNKRGFVGYNELEQAKADLYQLMLSLLPSQSKYKTVDSYKKAIRQKLSEHFNGEGGNMKITNWLEEKLFFLKTGSKLHIANNGNPVDEVVIRYKDFYFNVMIDIESGEPTGDFGWTHGSPMTHTPIREFYTAVRDTPTNSKEASTKGGEKTDE